MMEVASMSSDNDLYLAVRKVMGSWSRWTWPTCTKMPIKWITRKEIHFCFLTESFRDKDCGLDRHNNAKKVNYQKVTRCMGGTTTFRFSSMGRPDDTKMQRDEVLFL